MSGPGQGEKDGGTGWTEGGGNMETERWRDDMIRDGNKGEKGTEEDEEVTDEMKVGNKDERTGKQSEGAEERKCAERGQGRRNKKRGRKESEEEREMSWGARGEGRELGESPEKALRHYTNLTESEEPSLTGADSREDTETGGRKEGRVKRGEGEAGMEQIRREAQGLHSQFVPVEPLDVPPACDPEVSSEKVAEGRQESSTPPQGRSSWHKIRQAACERAAGAPAGAPLAENFFPPADGVLVRNEAHLSRPLRQPCEDAHVEFGAAVPWDDADTRHCGRIVQVPRPGHAPLQREKVFIRLSAREQQEAIQRLTDLQREGELKGATDRRRQMLRFQERLSIARNQKSEEDLLGATQRGSPQPPPEVLPQGDTEHQKTAVRERLERVKRERTYIMQSKRDRNTSSFRELLDPVLIRSERDEGGRELRGAEGV
ncbi:uncharacterized protein LOC142486006 [Ascaphus truei]|uniref:uncharacterized protein LOC142486006 n=1 Tax=Ascaphus truei TaxID=8439 RepID=UPI003F5A2F83